MQTVFALFGFRKSAKEGILVSVEVDNEKLSSSDAKYVSNPAKRGYESWWVTSLDLPDGSIVRLETKVGVRGKGQDSERTVSGLYIVDSDYPTIEVKVPKVGYRNYPLLKGKLRTITSKSLQDETEQMIEGILNEEE